MLQVQCLKIPVVPGKGAALRAWMADLTARRAEVLEALASEEVTDEAVFLATEGAQEYLYLYSRAADLAAAGRAFQESTLALDQEFKQLMSECLDLAAAQPLTLGFAADADRETVYS
jgi:hypothetical protein